MSHLDPDRYEVVPVGITSTGIWVAGTTDPEKLTAKGRELPTVSGGRAVSFDLGTPAAAGGAAGHVGEGNSVAEA